MDQTLAEEILSLITGQDQKGGRPELDRPAPNGQPEPVPPAATADPKNSADSEEEAVYRDLMIRYTDRLEDLAGRYEAGGLEFLTESHGEKHAELTRAEAELNRVWEECLFGRSRVSDFEQALEVWYQAQLKGIRLDAQREEFSSISPLK